MNLPTLWYEASPFLYALGGLGSVWGMDSELAFASGALLVLSATRVLVLRRRHRRAVAEHRRKYARTP
jgi:hypothetical protein